VWGDSKNSVYAGNPRTLQNLRNEIEITCAAVTPATIQEVCHSVARRCQQCFDADDRHFERL
jgi:hypothetical protein